MFRAAPARRRRPAVRSLRGRRSWPVLLLLGAGVLVHAPALDVPFLLDDGPGILRNPYIRRLDWPWHLAQGPAFAPPHGRPVVALSLALNYAWAGENVRPYHLVNLAVHLVNALLLCALLAELLAAAAPGLTAAVRRALSLGTALLWLVHPLPARTVAYVSERTASLAAFFYLLGLLAVVRSLRSPHPRRWWALALAASALGMATKEVAATLPLVAAGVLGVLDRRPLGTLVRRHGPWLLALAATWGILYACLPRGVGEGKVTLAEGPAVLAEEAWMYALQQARVQLHYLGLVFWPDSLLLDYGPLRPVTLGEVWPHLLLVLALALTTLLLLLRRRPLALAGLAWFGLLGPTSTVIPIYGEVAALRRMYLPAAVPLALALYGGWALLRRRPAARPWALGALVLAAILLGLRTRALHEAFHDPLGLWQEAAAHVPENPRAHLNLGVQYLERGAWAKAEASFRRVLSLSQGSWQAWYNLGSLYARQGRRREARAAYRRALTLAPRAFGHVALGELLAEEGQLVAAERHFRAALKLSPDYVPAKLQLARLLLATGRAGAARPLFEAVLRREPEHVPALWGLAWALLAGPRREPDRALHLAARAARLTRRRDPRVLEALAAAQAAAGSKERAAATAREALGLARRQGDEALAARLAARLRRYRGGSPR